MSQAAYKDVLNDFQSWEWEDAYQDKICLHNVSKVLQGRFRIAERDNQDCEPTDCTTLKHYDQFQMELTSGPCDSPEAAGLNGVVEGELVAAYQNSDLQNRGGHTGRFKGDGWLGRMRGVINAGTHHDPLDACEECHTVGHAEGWLRAAIMDGEHEGCRVAAMYALHFESDGESGGRWEGTLEGMIICQCSEEGG